MKKPFPLLIALSTLFSVIYGAGDSFAIDAPHDYTKTIACVTCHPERDVLPPWLIGTESADSVCINCHDNPALPIVMDPKYRSIKTHSSTTTSNTYGTWAIECRTCHSPHYQRQAVVYPTEGYVDYGTGTVSVVVSSTVLTDPSKTWTPDVFQGYLLVPNISNPTSIYRIIGNTAKTITVAGADFADKDSFVNYSVKFGKLINEKITTLNSGIKDVKFFNNQGTNSFAAGNVLPVNGVCQVCHLQTKSFKNTGTLEASGLHPNAKAGTDCTICHKHTGGFKVTGCNSCHGNPPTASPPAIGGPNGLVAITIGGTGSETPGAHQKHAVTLAYTCDTCHAGGMTESAPYDKKVQIGLNVPGGQGGTYTGRNLLNGYTYASGNDKTTIHNTGGMTCTTIYCHSNVQGEGGMADTRTYGTPAWNDASTGQCGSCHKADGVQGNRTLMASGSHSKHVSSYSMPCSQCHAGAGEGSAVHVNNVINVAIDPAVEGSYSLGNHSPGLGQYGSCSTGYCHSNGVGTYATPTWGNAGTGACGTCHGVTASTPPTSERHVKHVGSAAGYQYFCSTCHNDVVNASPNLAAEPAPFKDIHLHVNKIKNVVWDATNAGGTAYTSPGCSNIYCHSKGKAGIAPYDSAGNTPNITPSWTGALDSTCTGCHNGDRTAVNKMDTGSHSKHVVDNNYDCTKCHNETVSSSRMIGNPAYHVNKLVNIKFDAATNAQGAAAYNGSLSPMIKQAGTSFGACANIFCHSIVQTATGGSLTPNNASDYKTPTWGGIAMTCTSCHGNPPDSGTHQRHASGGSGRYTYTCVQCHSGRVPPGVTTHANGAVDTAISATWHGAYNGDTVPGNGFSTCSNVYCHSIVQTATGGALTLNNTSDYKTPTWGGDATTCTSCHGNPSASGSHLKHAGGAGQYTYTCEQCHSGYMPPNATATHADGAINTIIHGTGSGVYNGDTTPGNGFSNCSNTYCHSDGTSVATGVIPNNTSPVWGGGAGACNSCHGYPPSYPQMTNTGATPKANEHVSHMTYINTVYKCNGCHNTTTTTGNTITNPVNHANRQYDVVVAPGLTYSGTSVNFTYVPDPGGLGGRCDNVSCHGGTSAFWGRIEPSITSISIANGPSCYEAKFSVTAMTNITFPITYTWTFGDGTPSESGTSSAMPISSASHAYVDGTPRTVTITGRDSLQRYLSKSTTVTPQPIGNISPTGDFAVVDINRFTVTIQDLSYDPDYNSCGHGPGNIFITWKPGTTSNFVINLTDVRSNTSYTTTLGTYNAAGVYNIGHQVCDHAGTCSSVTYKNITLPGTTSISGKVFQSDGTGLAGVTVDLIREWYSIPPAASTTTDANGSYSFSGAYNYEYYRIVPSMAGHTFSPTYQYVYINRNDVNFTATP